MGDGHLNKCKECVKERVNKHREKNIEKIREYDRDRPNKHARYKKAWAVQKHLRQTTAFARKQCRAYNKIHRAISAGKVEKATRCGDCGKAVALHAHHNDYNKPLEVVWLCCLCHHQRHKIIGKGETMNPALLTEMPIV